MSNTNCQAGDKVAACLSEDSPYRWAFIMVDEKETLVG